jgi:hypothetical protein
MDKPNDPLSHEIKESDIMENIEESDSAQKAQKQMQYRDTVKTPSNSLTIISPEQIKKAEEAEKKEDQGDENAETKIVWKNTIDL